MPRSPRIHPVQINTLELPPDDWVESGSDALTIRESRSAASIKSQIREPLNRLILKEFKGDELGVIIDDFS